MIRLSVSDLESYRYWKADENATLETLLVRLLHEEPPSLAMEAGRAFAKVFESASGSHLDVREVDGWVFDFSGLESEIELPRQRELKAESLFHTPAGSVTLVGKVDGLTGFTVRDQKLTERWDAERYLDSLQWRAYLVMFKATRFVYDVFQGRYNGRRVELVDYQPMTFYAYPAMRQDVERAVSELAQVVKDYLPEKIAA